MCVCVLVYVWVCDGVLKLSVNVGIVFEYVCDGVFVGVCDYA